MEEDGILTRQFSEDENTSSFRSGKLHILLKCNSLVGQICYLAKFPVWVGRKSSTLDLNPKRICKMFRWLSYLDSMSKLPAKDETTCMVINPTVS